MVPRIFDQHLRTDTSLQFRSCAETNLILLAQGVSCTVIGHPYLHVNKLYGVHLRMSSAPRPLDPTGFALCDARDQAPKVETPSPSSPFLSSIIIRYSASWNGYCILPKPARRLRPSRDPTTDLNPPKPGVLVSAPGGLGNHPSKHRQAL